MSRRGKGKKKKKRHACRSGPSKCNACPSRPTMWKKRNEQAANTGAFTEKGWTKEKGGQGAVGQA